MHLDKYLKILIENKRFVAMCEEFPQYHKVGVRTFERRVVRVITPGTLIDESFLNRYENNYLLAIGSASMGDTSPMAPVGLAWIDVSTGEFYTKPSTLDNLRDDVARIGPREVVLSHFLKGNHPISDALNEDKNFISFVSPSDTSPDDHDDISDKSLDDIQEGVTDELMDAGAVGTVYTSEEEAAIRILTSFLKSHLLELMPSLSQPIAKTSTIGCKLIRIRSKPWKYEKAYGKEAQQVAFSV